MFRQFKDKLLNYIDNRKLQSILKEKNCTKRFERIYAENYWGSTESKSGAGSTLDATQALREKMREAFTRYRIASVLDIPCGDFHWMSHVDLSGINYLGADIVQNVVDSNDQKFSNHHVRFRKMNLISDTIPSVDLILTRDCLVHLSYHCIFSALKNIAQSGSKYLLATTFLEAENRDIETGQWRAIHLEKKPFFLPKPLEYINDHGPGELGWSKFLGLWDIKDFKKFSFDTSSL